MTSILKPPARIYKYSSFTAQNLENLKNQSIYFNSPRNFNDPYDCSVTPNILTPSDEDVESIRAKYLQETEASLPIHDQMKRASVERLREMFMKSARHVAGLKVKEFSEKRGVSCFSEDCDDLLMWAHYGGNYQGFCLEFDTSHFIKLHKVKYSETMPQFDLVPILKNPGESEDDGDLMSMFLSKSLSWAHEKEWRALHQSAGTLYCYPPAALTGVYFGPEISRAALEIICLILQGQNEKVLFWEGKRDANKYKVDFKKIDYFSHLQAKKKGLVPSG
jgi:hypothetical protein